MAHDVLDRHITWPVSAAMTLFTRHLIGVEVAGTLLLAALVGAVAIAIAQANERRSRREEGENLS